MEPLERKRRVMSGWLLLVMLRASWKVFMVLMSDVVDVESVLAVGFFDVTVG